VALIGGGSRPLPGEISLAHNGVLFLDELPEFASHTLDQLREPIESGYINIVRAGARVQYPSQFQLLAAMNPCKCGYYGDPSQPERCQCSAAGIEKYRGKVSGPLLDRIDLYIDIPRVKLSDLQELPQGESSAEIQQRVIKAQQTQLKRQGSLNVNLQSGDLDIHCVLNQQCQNTLRQAEEKLHLSARAYTKVIKIARTIADMQSMEGIEKAHIMEALGYRYT